MEKEIIRCIKSELQYLKVLQNSYNFNIDNLRNNIEKLQFRLYNIEYYYQKQRRKKLFLQIRHYLLIIFTIFCKKKYINQLDEIEEDITNYIFEYREIDKQKQMNDIELISSIYLSNQNLEYREKIENFLKCVDLLSDDEREKYLNYKMGDGSGKN